MELMGLLLNPAQDLHELLPILPRLAARHLANHIAHGPGQHARDLIDAPFRHQISHRDLGGTFNRRGTGQGWRR